MSSSNDKKTAAKVTAEPTVVPPQPNNNDILNAINNLANRLDTQQESINALTDKMVTIESRLDNATDFDIKQPANLSTPNTKSASNIPGSVVGNKVQSMMSSSNNNSSKITVAPHNGTTTQYQNETLVIVNAPPFDSVMKKLYISEIVKLTITRYEYFVKNGKVVPYSIALHNDIKERLINEHIAGSTTTIAEFDKFDDERVYDMLVASAMPKSMTAWIKCFKLSVKFPTLPDDYFPTTANLHPLYQAVLKFGRSCVEVVALLMHADAKFIPDLWNQTKAMGGSAMRDDCLISLYLEFFPNQLGYRLHKIFAKDNARVSIKTFEEYVSMFSKQMSEHYKAAEELAPMSSVLADYRSKLSTPKKLALSVLLPHELEPEEYDHAMSIELMNVELNHLSQTADRTNKDKLPGGCYLTMIGKPCPYGTGCKFSHDPKVLKETRSTWINDIAKIDYSKIDTEKKHVVIKERDRYKKSDMHNISSLPADSDDEA